MLGQGDTLYCEALNVHMPLQLLRGHGIRELCKMASIDCCYEDHEHATEVIELVVLIPVGCSLRSLC